MSTDGGTEIAASIVLAHIVQTLDKAEKQEGAIRIKIETIRQIIEGE